MKTRTKTLHAKRGMLMLTKEKAMQSIYACAPNNVTPFNECYAIAPEPTRLAFHGAVDALAAFERSMVYDEKRGYFSGYVFKWN